MLILLCDKQVVNVQVWRNVSISRAAGLWRNRSSDWNSKRCLSTTCFGSVKPHLHDTTCCQNRLNVCIHDTTGCQLYRVYKHSNGCQTSCTTQFDNRLNEQWLFIQHGCQTGLTTGWMFVYTIQLVVKPVVQPVVSCKRGFSLFAHRTIIISHIQLHCGKCISG